MAIGTAAVGLGTAAMSFFEGQEKQRAAEKAMRKFRFEELSNPYRRTAVSTLGADLQREQATAATAQSLDTLQSAGARGVFAGVPQIQAANQQMNNTIAADLDQRQSQLDLQVAGQDVRNQELTRRAQEQELAGYGQMMNVGMGMKYQGLGQLTNTFGYAGQQEWGQKADKWMGGLFGGNQNT